MWVNKNKKYDKHMDDTKKNSVYITKIEIYQIIRFLC
jgi:hypothetical protein